MICDYKWNSVLVCLCLLSSLFGCGPIFFCGFCDSRCDLFDGVSASTQMCGELFQSVCEGLPPIWRLTEFRQLQNIRV